jgi:hypothetical protein
MEESTSNSRRINFRCSQVTSDHIRIGMTMGPNIPKKISLSYDDPSINQKRRILIQTDWIELPRQASISDPEKFMRNRFSNLYSFETERQFIHIPLDPKQKSCQELKDFITRMDNFFDSPEIRINIFGKKKAKNFVYRSCLCQRSMEDDIFKIEFNSEKTNKILTKFVKNENGKKIRISLDSLTDVIREVRYPSEIRFVFGCPKLRIQKIDDLETYHYSIGFEIFLAEYKR